MLVKRVVITGIGTINPIGDNPEDYFSNLDLGVSGSSLITRFDTSLFKTKFACQIRDYSPERFGMDIKEARKHDRYTQYALIAAGQAIKDSRIPLDEEKTLRRTGVVIGSGIGRHRDSHAGNNGTIPKGSPLGLVLFLYLKS
jgi:3-oxoacyl-[acyl-carrier-protein] synthase II